MPKSTSYPSTTAALRMQSRILTRFHNIALYVLVDVLKDQETQYDHQHIDNSPENVGEYSPKK